MSKSFWRYVRFARPYWGLVLGAIVCGLLKFTLALSLPAGLGMVTQYVVVDQLTVSEKLTRLGVLLGGLTVALLARTPVTFLRSYLAARACHRTVLDIRHALYNHVQRLSLTYHHQRRTGNITARIINDLNAAQGLLNDGIVSVAMDILFLTGVVVFLFVMDWQLTVVSLFTLPIYGVVFFFINPRIRKASTEAQQEMEEMSGEVTEKLAAIQVVKSFVREETEQDRFLLRQMRYFGKVMHRVRLNNFLTTVAEFLQAFGPVVVISYGGYQAIHDVTFLPKLVWFYGFIQHLYLPTRRLADCSAVVQEKLAAMDRVFEILDSEPDIEDAPGAIMLREVRGQVRFDRVHFSYLYGKPVLEGVSFEVEPGQAAAIVGRSGAGKTTLVNLLPRFYDVGGGAVLVDGHDIRGVNLKSLRRHIGIVLQDSILFTGTIRENILYGRPDATEDEMREAARMAHVDEFAALLPDDYDTRVGERGVTLSGGQKQRVSIARAFLYNPRILILDEATSSLDSRAEMIIQNALRELMRGRTTLVIAHRLSTIMDCDFVIVLDNGEIVEQGPHFKLLRQDGLYRRLCEEQFGHVALDELTTPRAG